VVKRFDSKKDLTFPIILGFIFLIYASIGFSILINDGDYSAIYLLAGVWIGLVVMFFVVIKSTFYSIDDEYLICHTLGFKKKITLSDIKKIVPQKGLYAGFKINTAWKGIVVHYGKWDEILISPADEKGLIEAVRLKNPNLTA